MSRAAVTLWGNRIGAVDWDEGRGIGVFQYDSDFARSGIEVSPFMMPLREEPYEFPSLRRESFIGLPGLLADSLPDRFGNRLIDEWIAETARDAGDFNPVDRLCLSANAEWVRWNSNRKFTDRSNREAWKSTN